MALLILVVGAMCVTSTGCGPATSEDASLGSGAAEGAARFLAAGDAPLAGQDCVIILLDALHADQLGCYGGPRGVSPHLDRFAASGVRFRHVWSQASWTLPSTVSLFTGLYPETHGVSPPAGVAEVRLGDQAETMAERFAAAGYDTRCFTQNPWTGKAYGMSQGFEVFREVRTDGPSLAGVVLEDLERRDERPLFAYVHFRRPHTPFDAAPEHRRGLVAPEAYGELDGTDEGVEAFNRDPAAYSEADLAHHRALYHANIRHVDAAVGRLLDGLDRQRTLVVILSDHGEAVGQHGMLGHNWLSYEEYVHVPLLLQHPALPPGLVVDAPAMSIDVLPTLIGLMGLAPPPAPLPGRSLEGLMRGEASSSRPIFSGSRVSKSGQRQVTVFDGRFKYIRRQPDGREWLFDLLADPAEVNDLSASRAADRQRLSQGLDAWLESQHNLGTAEWDVDLDPEVEARLRELGYLNR